jgi:class 3 adenylate cyclase
VREARAARNVATMTAQPTLLLIADIAGYTRFMKFHNASLAHAQETVAQLLEVVIDAAGPLLRLAKLEGDAAFFYMAAPAIGRIDAELLAAHVATIYRAFHARAAELRVNAMCPCDGCQQAGNLKIKLVGHLGNVAMQKVKQLTELAGVDVIVVHRMLKNDVPVPEYLLMTAPVHAMLAPSLRERAAPFELVLDDFGATPAYYLDLAACVEALPPPRPMPALPRLARHLALAFRTLPYAFGLRKGCIGFRNVPDAPGAR